MGNYLRRPNLPRPAAPLKVAVPETQAGRGLLRPAAYKAPGEAICRQARLNHWLDPRAGHRSHCKTGFHCHPERSEGSQATKNKRFFATLGMTFLGRPGVLQ